MRFKKYFLLKFIDILPVEDSFFFKVKFDKKVKLTDELIALNYKKNAPYKNPFFTTLMEEKNLYIWFYEQKINSKFILPESYLFFNLFKKENPNTLLFIESNNASAIIIIKDNILVNSYTLADEDETLIAMEMQRYGLSSFKKINKEEYAKSREKALESIGFKELYRWNSINVESQNLFPNIINSVAYPLSFLLFFIMSVELYHLNEVEKKLERVEEEYSNAKNKNDDIRKKINYENEKEQKWIDFIHRELPYSDPLTIFLRVSKSFDSSRFTFKHFSVVGSRVKMSLETKEDTIVGLNILNKIEGLKNVSLKYSNKKRQKVMYEATLVAKGLAL